MPDASIAQIDLVDAIKDEAPIDRPIVVHVDHGRLTDVVVTEGPSRVLKGELSEDGRTWTSQRAYLDFDSTYKIEATAVDPRGQTATFNDQIRTVNPDGFLKATPTLEAGTEFGVGMPLTVDFDEAVNVTLGLPHVRTSPDHGTAFGIAGQGSARITSFANAVTVARRLHAGRAAAG